MSSPDETRARFERIQRFEKEAFMPSRTIERLILQVLGGWSNLVEAVRWQRFHIAGVENKDEVVHPNADQLGKLLKNIARDAGIRVPGSDFKAAATMIREVRNDLAHMLYLQEIEGKAPHRTVTYVRVESLEFRDEVWSAQNRRTVTVTEDQLRDALAATQWLIRCSKWISRVRQIVDEYPDDVEVPGGVGLFPWWFDDWGDQRTAVLKVGDLKAS